MRSAQAGQQPARQRGLPVRGTAETAGHAEGYLHELQSRAGGKAARPPPLTHLEQVLLMGLNTSLWAPSQCWLSGIRTCWPMQTW